jgi:2'-5' RNA ligase
MPDDLRLFVACPVSDDVIGSLTAVQNDLRAAGFNRLRYVRPEGIHITLKFLGGVAANRVGAIIEALATTIRPFEFSLVVQGLGGFRGGRMAGRVIWAGVRGVEQGYQPTGPLNDLANVVEGALGPLGFPPENRRFAPHLTLARMPRELSVDARRQLDRFLQSYKFSVPPPMIVKEVLLMQSFLGPGGSKYEQLASFPAERR